METRLKLHMLKHIVDSLLRNGNCDETNGAMFESVTAATRDDAQGNWHDVAKDMLLGSIALQRLRTMASDPVNGFSSEQNSMLQSMEMTSAILRTSQAPKQLETKCQEQVDNYQLKFSVTKNKESGALQFTFCEPHVVAVRARWLEPWTTRVMTLQYFLQERLSVMLTSELTDELHCVSPRGWSVSIWNRFKTASSGSRAARADVGTWVTYASPAGVAVGAQEFGCVRFIASWGRGVLLLIQRGRLEGVDSIQGIATTRVHLLDSFDAISDPATLLTVRCAPVHHDCPRCRERGGRCVVESIQGELRVVHDIADGHFFIDPNHNSVNRR